MERLPEQARVVEAMCPLSDCPSMSKVRIISVEGGKGLQRRCLDMGIFPGSEVIVLMNYGGKMQIRCRKSCFAVGQGLAGKIFVANE